MQEEQKPIITFQNAYLMLARHIPDVENVKIIEIYQRYKLSD